MKDLRDAHEILQLEKRVRRLYGMERISVKQLAAAQLCIRALKLISTGDEMANRLIHSREFCTLVEEGEIGVVENAT